MISNAIFNWLSMRVEEVLRTYENLCPGTSRPLAEFLFLLSILLHVHPVRRTQQQLELPPVLSHRDKDLHEVVHALCQSELISDLTGIPLPRVHIKVRSRNPRLSKVLTRNFAPTK